MTKKRKILLLIYAIVIILILIFILFIAPDTMFTDDIDIDFELPKTDTKEFMDYQKQQEHLLQKNYNYEYVLLDSMGKKSYQFNCEGKREGQFESGTCTLPENISYTQDNRKDAYKLIDSNYLEPSYIFDLLTDIKPEEAKYQESREYTYKIKIKDLDTDVIVTTDLDNITKIIINNAYMNYILKFSDVKY